MPKKPGGVSKSERQNKLRKVLQQWGSLEKQQINQRVAQALGIDPNYIEKPLYKDLEELVEQGEIVVTYYHPDGSVIEDFDPETHRTSKGKWSIPRFEGQVAGAGILKPQGAELIVSSSLKNEVRVDQGASTPDSAHTYIYFNINSYFFSIRILSQMLPATLLICRSNDPVLGNVSRINQHFKTLERDFGRRIMLLIVPSTGVSAPKIPERMGHLSLEIKGEDLALLRDLGSSNGTLATPISREEALDLIEDGSVIGMRTLTRSWNHHPVPSSQSISCSPHMVQRLKFPSLIQASESFRMLVMNGAD